MKILNGLDVQNQPITGVPTTPTDPNHAASKAYVDAIGGGGGSQQVFVQYTRPVATAPFVWYVTDVTNTSIVNMLINI